MSEVNHKKADSLSYLNELGARADLPENLKAVIASTQKKLQNQQFGNSEILSELSSISKAIYSLNPRILLCQNHISTSVRPETCPISATPSSPNILSRQERARYVLEGLACGDSLGSCSEFQIPWNIPQIIEKSKGKWPCSFIASSGWKEGAPTDDTDMSLCVSNAIHNNTFDPKEAARNFLNWARSGPEDIGSTTRISLEYLRFQDQWVQNGLYWVGGKKYYERSQSCANGSLMRNGPIAALMNGCSEIDLINATVSHGIITHYAPLPVLTCVVHSILISRALKYQNPSNEIILLPTMELIKEILNGPWTNWKQQTEDPGCREWLKTIGFGDLKIAEKKLIEELNDFENLDPYHFMYRGISGFCVLTLKIALWALYWALKRQPPNCGIPNWLISWPFYDPGHFGIGIEIPLRWVVLIGADADTYGAVAGALLGAYFPAIPSEWHSKLEVANQISQIVSKIS